MQLEPGVGPIFCNRGWGNGLWGTNPGHVCSWSLVWGGLLQSRPGITVRSYRMMLPLRSALEHEGSSVERVGVLLDGVGIVIGLLELIQAQFEGVGLASFQQVPEGNAD